MNRRHMSGDAGICLKLLDTKVATKHLQVFVPREAMLLVNFLVVLFEILEQGEALVAPVTGEERPGMETFES